ARGIADIEAAAGAAPVAVAVPVYVALHLVARVEAAALEDALGEAERHGGIIRPLARGEAVGSAAAQVVERREAARPLELDGRAERVAGGESEERAGVAMDHASCSVAGIRRARRSSRKRRSTSLQGWRSAIRQYAAAAAASPSSSAKAASVA